MRTLHACCALVLLAAPVSAQVTTGKLEGSVQDQTGAIVPTARIMVVNNRTRVSLETGVNTDGLYVFPTLQPGEYTVTAEAPGFRKSVHTSVTLNVADTVAENFRLEVGQVTETVTVEASTVRVQTSETSVGRAINLRDIDVLPQLGRQPLSLAIFQAGVQIDGGDGTFSRINGLRQGSNNSTLDGIDVNDAVVPRLGLSLTANNTDSVGEFRIITEGG
ncbi:MAG: carboxypeptidase regulatory-like domain-containing protein, partial [Acidobacteria bacterium]|nr:carboxypeptidase regulatory-like domain-containing protein [Acidobacteriota bacterium]